MEPELHRIPGHKLTRRYAYSGFHQILMVEGESFNINMFVPTRRKARATSKYEPHQGAQECARRRTQCPM